MRELKKISEFKGIKGNLNALKEAVGDCKKIAYAGVPGVCTPFAQLFAYALRDKDNIFIPNTDVKKARKLILTSYGVELGEKVEAKADALVLLGGLAMPKIGVDVEEVKKLINNVLTEEGKIIGACFMDVFRKAGWHKEINFDCIIDAVIKGSVLK